MTIRAWAPGRVNLIGEHTDYTGGLAMPMAIQLGITIEATFVDGRIRLTSDSEPEPLAVVLPIVDPSVIEPAWGRYVAGVAAQLAAETGIDGRVTSTLPPGAGLSSSAALEVATALALSPGDHLDRRRIAEACQRAEQRATGVPCGVMDQMASVSGIDGHALLLDCDTLDVEPVPMGDDVSIAVVHSGQERRLAGSAYADRRRECELAEAVIGPLRLASPDDVDAIEDETIRRRARHVTSENERVRSFADALRRGDAVAAGELVDASHRSLRDDFEVSTDVLDELVDHLRGLDGVLGARLTGAGFGGCVVALCRPGVDPTPPGRRGWFVEPSRGAYLA